MLSSTASHDHTSDIARFQTPSPPPRRGSVNPEPRYLHLLVPLALLVIATGGIAWLWWTQMSGSLATSSADDRTLVLLAGLVVALLSILGAAQVLVHRRRENARTAAHLAALEALSKLSSAITDKPVDSDQVLAQLAELASRLMHMSMRIVSIYDAASEMFRVIHRAGIAPSNPRDIYHVHETPLSKICMQERRVLMFGHLESESPIPATGLLKLGIRSAIIFPLLTSSEPTGVIILADAGTRRFGRLDRQLAELWCIEAAALLSNRSLYKQMGEALDSSRRLLEQRDMMYQVHMQIQNASSLREALHRLAELAPRALGVDACVVCFAEGRGDLIQIAAVTATNPPNTMPQDAVVECAVCASVLRSGRMQIVEDAAELHVRGFPDMGSVVFVPLICEGLTIGLLVLLRRQKGPFNAQHIQLAEMFASRTAAAIESTRLHEQTRRQAETNAILLRELNHRVGNNLASIVGLLSMGAAKLPNESRQWLGRAIERVSMMARAHELFSGGMKSVRLDELVRTTLASVAAVKRPDVRIDVALDQIDAKLESARAITLAMVLHELAYNALVHGLREGGELSIRARRLSQDRVAIDVVDRASQPAGAPLVGPPGNGDSHETRGGIGLELVRNLVSRELRGRFELRSSDDGPTVATVELAVEQEPEPSTP